MNENKKKRMYVITSIVVALIIIMCTIFAMIPKTPKIEQLKADFINEKFDDKEISVTEFKIDSEITGNNENYEVIANVIYNDGRVEYEEKYLLVYNKSEEWLLDDIDGFEKENWTKNPLVVPTTEEFEKTCLSNLYSDGIFIEYDTFKAIENKTEKNLSEGKVKYVYMAEKKTDVINVLGEIEFEVKFDYERGVWEIDNYQKSDSFSMEHNLIQTWKGKGPHCGVHGTEIVEKDFSLIIKEFCNGEAKGILKCEGKDYSVSGKIIVPEELYSHYSIDMYNTSEMMRIEGFMNVDGEMFVTVDTAYNPDSIFYYPIDRYDVDMLILK